MEFADKRISKSKVDFPPPPPLLSQFGQVGHLSGFANESEYKGNVNNKIETVAPNKNKGEFDFFNFDF